MSSPTEDAKAEPAKPGSDGPGEVYDAELLGFSKCCNAKRWSTVEQFMGDGYGPSADDPRYTEKLFCTQCTAKDQERSGNWHKLSRRRTNKNPQWDKFVVGKPGNSLNRTETPPLEEGEKVDDSCIVQ
eukprot:GFYU01006933.1.p1 GENE.GFYU01006933.1~~GFYU01006933.1.p1  ORF type:complete len:128 (+),score=20.23 GFYU01006933.1:111-494(+)